MTVESATHDDSVPSPAAGMLAMPLVSMIDLQDHLLAARSDLGRLESLLGETCHLLMRRFHEASLQAGGLPTTDPAARDALGRQIAGAVTALQFQDIASQLIAHTCSRLAYCSDRLAQQAFDDDDEDAAGPVRVEPLRPNPVTRSEMDAGSVELF